MNRIPLVVSPRQTIGELQELGIERGFLRIEYDVKRRVFYGVTTQEVAPLVRDANAELMALGLEVVYGALMDDTCIFHKRQAT